jgi:hypothetical protein
LAESYDWFTAGFATAERDEGAVERIHLKPRVQKHEGEELITITREQSTAGLCFHTYYKDLDLAFILASLR